MFTSLAYCKMLTKQTYNFKHILFPIYTYGKQFNLQTYNFMVL